MFDTLTLLPALIAIGLFAAAVLPKPDVSGKPAAWTEADFARVVKSELGIEL